jgi:hypothetical protein
MRECARKCAHGCKKEEKREESAQWKRSLRVNETKNVKRDAIEGRKRKRRCVKTHPTKKRGWAWLPYKRMDRGEEIHLCGERCVGEKSETEFTN